MKSCFAFSISLSFLLNLLSVYPPSSESAPTYLWHNCPNATLFVPNSTYQSNLNTLLSSLSSAAATTNNMDGFANATAGQNPPDKAYGLFLCRSDVSAATCSDCVATGKQDILQRCPDQRVSAIWYDECMLRYSNQSIFSVLEVVPALTMYNTRNITDPVKFVQVLSDAIINVAWRASDGESGKKVAVGEANFMNLQTLYTLAQCTPDLTAGDCNTCLRKVIPSLPEGMQGGRILTPSCTMRFELYPFYNESALLAPPPPPVTTPKGKSNKSAVIITIAIIAPVGGVMVLLLTWGLLRRKGKKTYEVGNDKGGANELTTVESLQFDLATIQAATNDFSHEKKLGEGGFGEVFQGRLPNGQQIAVKRLSQSSRQGDEEFKNEVMLVAKLRHRNLVRLLGFCLEGDEKLLAYEFVPNKSLDYFLFEYAMHGEFSVKSDVYSFGILLLEIICGKRNNFYHQLKGGEYLASYVWNQWREGTPLEVLDKTIVDSFSRDEVLRCLHICLLCIQEDPAIRPTMATVVLMLSSNSFTPPSPRHPAFFVRSRSRGLSIPMEEPESDQAARKTMPSSTNGMSVTELYPR